MTKQQELLFSELSKKAKDKATEQFFENKNLHSDYVWKIELYRFDKEGKIIRKVVNNK